MNWSLEIFDLDRPRSGFVEESIRSPREYTANAASAHKVPAVQAKSFHKRKRKCFFLS